MELDIKDKKILYELGKNARQPNSKIAKKVLLSKDSIGYRIKRLESKGIIRGYQAIIDTQGLGYSLFRVYFKLIDISEKKLNEMVQFLKKEKNTWWIAKLDGTWDFVFAFWAKENQDFYDFYFGFFQKFRRYIKEKLISPMINYQEFPRKYLTGSKRMFPFEIKKRNKINIDKIDINILKEISKNARKSVIDLAEKFKVDSKTIINRIKRLEQKHIILGYKVDLNVSKLKRDFYTIEIDLNNFSKFKELEKEISSLKELTARSTSIGAYDLEFDIEIENTQRYYEIIKKLKEKFPEIREIRYFRIIKNYKILYMPED